ncbi:outer membrane protein W [Elusimicrobium posterum]|uniref:hypothetical protein n=1 Tax=Elusimicrobium posterum TaxID=3116653 RepID=UPI003C73EC08
MMKKILLPVMAVVFLGSAVFAEIGVGVKAGYGKDDSNIKSGATGNVKHDDDFVGAYSGVEALYEMKGSYFNLPDNHSFGVRVGLDVLAEDVVKQKTAGIKTTSNGMKIPLSLYYRYTPTDSKFSSWIGAGAAWGFMYYEQKAPGKRDETENKIFPFVSTGVEYRFTRFFSLGIDGTYNFSAKIKSDKFNAPNGSTLYRDLGGLSGAVTARFYF